MSLYNIFKMVNLNVMTPVHLIYAENLIAITDVYLCIVKVPKMFECSAFEGNHYTIQYLIRRYLYYNYPY